MKFEQRYTAKTIPKTAPAAQCFLCEMPVHAAPGRPIVATSSVGMLLTTSYYYGQWGKCFYFASQLNPSSNLYLQYWSDLIPMNPVLLQRARAAFLADTHPWFCHVCADRSCRACGEPMQHPMASDVLNAMHEVTHIPIFPTHPGCVSKTCVYHRQSH